MKLEGYAPRDVRPWETASGGKAVACAAASCGASLKHEGPAGWFRLHVQYFDQIDGSSRFRVRVGNQVIDEWTADLRIPTRRLDGSSSTRRAIAGVTLRSRR